MSKNTFTTTRKGGGTAAAKRLSIKPGIGRGQIIYRSHLNVVETYGPSLPVLVREALTFSEKNCVASARIANDGWAWFVCGRRLLIWQCDTIGEDGRRRPVASQCRELTLPSSDLAYRAQLVILFSNSSQKVPSCIASSPEGVVRYWQSIAHEGSSVEVNADLHGQECDSLTDIWPMGCILATTTASVVLLTTNVVGGRPNILVRPFRPPQGWLGGITRLIPSLIFGSMQASHGMETKLVKVAAARIRTGWILYMLAGHTLQQWLLSPRDIERLVYECDISKLAVEAFQKTIWEVSGGNASDIIIWLLDVQPIEDGVCVLLGATNPQLSLQFFYALGTLLPNESQQPTRFDRFCPVRANTVYRESDDNDLLTCRLLLYRGSALLYTRHSLLAVSATNFGEDADNLNFIGPSNEILGASLCRNVPILFTKEHGLVVVTSVNSSRSEINESISDMATADSSVTSLNQEPLAVTVAVSEADLEGMECSSECALQMEAAFIYFLRRNHEKADRILGSSIPQEERGGDLDAVVVRVSLDLIDATPSGDPRWAAEGAGHVLGPSSLQIVHQLEDKIRMLDTFFTFLKWSKIWEKLNSYRRGEMACDTKLILVEHREKLVAALALKQLYSSNASIIDQCIQHAVGASTPKQLSAQDIFFREVSKFDFIIEALVTWTEILAHSDRRPQEVAASISTANQIILKLLEAVQDWRQQNLNLFAPSEYTFEFLPWTAALGLRQALMLQHSLTIKYGAHVTGEAQLRSKLNDEVLRLADIILDGWRTHLTSVRNLPKYEALSQQFDATKSSLIKPLLDDGEYERAAVLGEKYCDFNLLIQICEKTDNIDLLDNYCNKYSDQNFTEYLFNWYIKEGKPGRLLERFRSQTKPSQQQLSSFLGDHPSLSWLQDVFCHDFVRASCTLQAMANSEKELLHRKKTMVSLSKLCELASGEQKDVVEEKVNELDAELDLISLQEDLPHCVLAAHGLDATSLRVLSPSEIIKLYISEQNVDSSEADFKRALDLLNYVSDDLDRNVLRHSIWCRAIVKDCWGDLHPDAPLDSILNLFFFRLVDLLECMGCSLDELLPPVASMLEAEELGDLRNDRQFQYLIRLGYEHFQKPSD